MDKATYSTKVRSFWLIVMLEEAGDGYEFQVPNI